MFSSTLNQVDFDYKPNPGIKLAAFRLEGNVYYGEATSAFYKNNSAIEHGIVPWNLSDHEIDVKKVGYLWEILS